MEPLDELVTGLYAALPFAPPDAVAAAGAVVPAGPAGSIDPLNARPTPQVVDGGQRGWHAQYWALAKTARARAVAADGPDAARAATALGGGALSAGTYSVDAYVPAADVAAVQAVLGGRAVVRPLAEARGVDVAVLDGRRDPEVAAADWLRAASLEDRGRALVAATRPGGALLVDGVADQAVMKEAAKLRGRSRAVLDTMNGTLLLLL